MGFVNFVVILADVSLAQVAVVLPYGHKFQCLQGMNADLVVVGALVLLWAFGGMVQTYSSIINSLGQFGMLLNYISPFKWSMELQVCVNRDTYSTFRLTISSTNCVK